MMPYFLPHPLSVEVLNIIKGHPGFTKLEIENLIASRLRFQITFNGYLDEAFAKLQAEDLIFKEEDTRDEKIQWQEPGGEIINVTFQITEEKYYPMAMNYFWKRYRCEICYDCF